MKKTIIAILFLTQTFAIGIYAQPKSLATKTPRRVEYEKLDDFLKDVDHRQPGERVVISGAHLIENIVPAQKRHNYLWKDLYVLEAGGFEEPSLVPFYSSPKLAKQLRPVLESTFTTESLRVECTLVYVSDGMEAFYIAFATKIEGISEDGSVNWTVMGTPPVKVRREG